MKRDHGKPIYIKCRIPAGTLVEHRLTCEHDWKEKQTTRDLWFNRIEYEAEGRLVFMLLPRFIRVAKRHVSMAR